MASAFEIVVIAVAAVGVLGALVALAGSRRTWEGYGRDHLLKDSDLPAARPGTAASSAPGDEPEREHEIRQMLDAANLRRRRRGLPELDADAELARLRRAPAVGGSSPAPEPAAPAVDAELRAEIRELVIARHRRRARRAGGPPAPLDVEAEVAREIARLAG